MKTGLEHSTKKKISEGKYYPLGATPGAGGVNFALYSKHAREVFLCLYEQGRTEPTDVIGLAQRTRDIWHCFVHGIGPGHLYAYRVRGDFDPAHGHRFNEHKLLLDPYARAFAGKVRNTENLLLAYDQNAPGRDMSRDERDSASAMPRSVVADDAFDWQGDARPDIPLGDLVIYEVHVKGFTAHPSSGVSRPGTYAGFVERIEHLKRLGINAVELLPVQEFYVEDFLHARGLANYWGYNTMGFFAPESSYAADPAPGAPVREFKTLVRELHRAGIEVLLDVVYNHTAEGNELGPVISFKGIDNASYYALTGPEEAPGRYYMNYTGCGNSLNLASAPAIRLVMDSLRYWVECMHVDGFRFDLASVLGRGHAGFERSASFFDAIAQDPVLSRVKLIAEPWDLGTYQAGNFPVDWSEWNGRFRDAARRFGKGDSGTLSEMGWRITGSADLYADDGRTAYNSVNFITCHDGFTLCDLVSYGRKHNEANLEENRDGSDDNNSWNCGYEGPTAEPYINELRARMAKNHLCILLFSLGTPMLLGGDEFMRTQRGNNNAYCQDNDLSWFDWGLAEKNAGMIEFCRKAIAFRRRHRVLHGRKFLLGRDLDADGVPDITWFDERLGTPDWNNPENRTLCYRLDCNDADRDGENYFLFFIFNADFNAHEVMLPPLDGPYRWRRVIDTALTAPDDIAEEEAAAPRADTGVYPVKPRSVAVMIARA
ncbi:MAG: glycogen debranching enzyme GlgX [Spirochaetes bacterium]|nr:MAG: glycogen debranching enzyme GlgX [Spirochaetota bacterium]